MKAHEKLEEVKKAAALAAAEASRVPRVPRCARCAAVLSNTANFSAACGYPVSAVGSTPRADTPYPTKDPESTSASSNPTQQQQPPASSVSDQLEQTGGGNAPRLAIAVVNVRDALGGSSSAVSLPSPGLPGRLTSAAQDEGARAFSLERGNSKNNLQAHGFCDVLEIQGWRQARTAAA